MTDITFFKVKADGISRFDAWRKVDQFLEVSLPLKDIKLSYEDDNDLTFLMDGKYEFVLGMEIIDKENNEVSRRVEEFIRSAELNDDLAIIGA